MTRGGVDHGDMRSRKTILWVVTSLLVLPMLFVAGIYITHPRSEDQFLASMQRADYPQEWLEFVSDRDDEFFLHEGDRACHWLREQSIAGLRTGNSVSLRALMDEYLDVTANVDSAWELDETVFAGRRLVAASAWSNLCGATLIVHRPYHPFGNPNG
jgi:hypothetical protein